MNEAYRRGDVILARIPFISEPAQEKTRPAVVIQNDVGNRVSPNLIVVPVSSRVPSRRYPTVVIVSRGDPHFEGTGLERDSAVQAGAITTISKSRVLLRVGRLSPAVLAALDQAVRVSLRLLE